MRLLASSSGWIVFYPQLNNCFPWFCIPPNNGINSFIKQIKISTKNNQNSVGKQNKTYEITSHRSPRPSRRMRIRPFKDLWSQRPAPEQSQKEKIIKKSNVISNLKKKKKLEICFATKSLVVVNHFKMINNRQYYFAAQLVEI